MYRQKSLYYWAELLSGQQAVFNALINTYQSNAIANYEEYAEYSSFSGILLYPVRRTCQGHETRRQGNRIKNFYTTYCMLI